MKRDCVTDTPMAELQRSVLQIWHSIKFRVEIAVALQGPSTMSASSTFGVEHWRITTLSPFSVRKKKKKEIKFKKFIWESRNFIFYYLSFYYESSCSLIVLVTLTYVQLELDNVDIYACRSINFTMSSSRKMVSFRLQRDIKGNYSQIHRIYVIRNQNIHRNRHNVCITSDSHACNRILARYTPCFLLCLRLSDLVQQVV